MSPRNSRLAWIHPLFNLELKIRSDKLERVETHVSLQDIDKAFARLNPDFSTAAGLVVQEKSDFGRRAAIALVAFLIWVMSVVFIAIIPALFLLPYLASAGVSLSDTAQIVEFSKSDTTAIFIQLAAIVPAHVLTFILAYLVVGQLRRYDFLPTLGWSSGGVRWWHYAIILGAFFAVAAAVSVVMPEQDNELLRILRSSRYAVYVVALVATFSAPLIEEIVYRGVLYSAFQKALGVPAAFAMVTLLFALVHVPQYYPSYSTILLLTLLSMTLTALRVYSNNLLPCVILHTIFNGFQSLILLLEPLLPVQTQPDPASIFLWLK